MSGRLTKARRAKPDDIPADVWEAAWIAANNIPADYTYDGQSDGVAEMQEGCEVIARATLAERERCAKVADDHARAWGLAMGSGATEIAAAIRKGTP
jgi:hypothetical protein